MGRKAQNFVQSDYLTALGEEALRRGYKVRLLSGKYLVVGVLGAATINFTSHFSVMPEISQEFIFFPIGKFDEDKFDYIEIELHRGINEIFGIDMLPLRYSQGEYTTATATTSNTSIKLDITSDDPEVYAKEVLDQLEDMNYDLVELCDEIGIEYRFDI